MKMMKYPIILIIGFVLITGSSAQDTHYWNLQYGTRSTLLGGAVIGSVSDMAATYYNPAALALFSAPEILLSGKVYQYNSLSMKNGAGPGKDLTSSTIEVAKPGEKPRMVAVETVDVLAEISAIDQKTREVTITGPMGNSVTLQADESVENFKNLKVGDKVHARYTEAVAIGITEK